MRRQHHFLWKRRALIALGLTTVSLIARGQNHNGTPAADSIQISNIHASGNLASGQVEISMDFTNNYYRPATVHLVLGGFDGLGLIDNKGNKYKIHTSDQLYNTAGINNGFTNISFVQFGDKTFKSLTYVEQKVAQGESRQLIIRIPKVDSSVTAFTQINTHRQVSINYALVADVVIKLSEVKIQWAAHAAGSK